MNEFQQMTAIPQQEYVALSSLQQVKEPLAQQFYKAENNLMKMRLFAILIVAS